MKRKIVILLLSATLLLSACSNTVETGNTQSGDAQTTDFSGSQEESVVGETAPAESTPESSEPEVVKVDENLFSVEITLPADSVGEVTQDELDELAAKKEYKSITLNDDGSATYIMTKAQHKLIMDDMTANITSTLDSLIGSEEYPNFTDIQYNDDFTKFTVTTKSTQVALPDTIATMSFYMYGGTYNLYNGTPVDNITVEFINADTNEVISTANSSEMGK